MAIYEYTAVDKNGSEFCGIYCDVDSVGVLREDMAKMGDTLLKAKRRRPVGQKRIRVKQGEIVTFTFKLAGMCSAGLSIVRCLKTVEEQTPNHTFRYVLSDIRHSIETGSSLKEAFEKHKDIFSDFFIGMIEAGESGGNLSNVLEMSANYLEKQNDLRRKVKSAFAYPIVIAVMCILVIASLVIFVIPVFSKLYQQMHLQLPWPTKALVDVSTFVRDSWWAILLIAAVIVWSLKRFRKNPRLKARWDAFKLKMPIFARLNCMVVVSRFIRTFSMLASAGVSLVRAFGVAGVVADNSKLSDIAEQLQQSIEAGNPVAGSLKNHSIFPPMIIQLADSGENAGKLSEMLNKGVDFLEKDIDRIIHSLLVKLEPAMTVIMGIIVGFILIGVYFPMFDYMSHIK